MCRYVRPGTLGYSAGRTGRLRSRCVATPLRLPSSAVSQAATFDVARPCHSNDGFARETAVGKAGYSSERAPPFLNARGEKASPPSFKHYLVVPKSSRQGSASVPRFPEPPGIPARLGGPSRPSRRPDARCRSRSRIPCWRPVPSTRR
jgi:hypothetical protein